MVLPLHWKPLQLAGAGTLQVPPPLQWPAACSETLEQDGSEQTVDAQYLRHTPLPLHAPSVPHEVAGSAAQSLRGSEPFFTDRQLPDLAAQSLSLVLLQVLGQQQSLFAQAVWTRSFSHSAVQLLPFTSFLCWQPLAGQLVGLVDSGSQVSAPSLMPLSHLIEQSL